MKTKQPISKAKSMRTFFAPRARSPAPVVGGGGAPAPAPQPAPAVAPAPALAPAPAPRDRMAFFASAPTAAAVRTERRRKASKLIVAAKITNPSESFVDALSAMFAQRELHGRKPTVLSEVKGIMDGLITDVRKALGAAGYDEPGAGCEVDPALLKVALLSYCEPTSISSASE